METKFKDFAEAFVKISNVQLAYLFGSQAKGRPSKRSDIDIAVLLKEPLDNLLEIKLKIIGALQDALEQEIDLTILNTAGSILKYQVVKNGQLLFERNPGDHKKFQIASWNEYFDFQPTLEFFYQRKIA